MHTALLVLAATATLGTVGAAKLPSDFTRCSQKKQNFNECLRGAVEEAIHKLKNGAPNLGIFPLDPLEVTTIDLGQGSGPVNFGLRFDNIKIYGISGSSLKNQRSSLKDYSLSVEAYTPKLLLEADYTMDGRVLLLPVNGKGKGTIKLFDMKSQIEQKGVPLYRNGQIFMNETEFSFKIDPGNMEMHFSNLFNGDVQLGENMNNFINENWREVLKELKPALERAFGEVFNNIANRIFLKVPFNEIFPED